MSLDFTLTDIEDWEVVCYDKFSTDGDCVMSTVTETLIFNTVAVGIPVIDDSNVATFYARRQLIEKLYGEGVHISVEALKQHIGLRTNASRMTEAKFFNFHCKYFLGQKTREAKEELDK